jgi:ABC-type methionine transport system ATPase subunit
MYSVLSKLSTATILIITHKLGEIERICSEVIIPLDYINNSEKNPQLSDLSLFVSIGSDLICTAVAADCDALYISHMIVHRAQGRTVI